MTVVSKRNIDALQDANDFLHKADESIGAAFAAFDFIEGMDASRGEKKEYAIGILEALLEAWVKTKDALAKVRAALAEAKGGEE